MTHITMYNPVNSAATSFSATLISSSVSAPYSSAILPRIGALSAGVYHSEILSIADAVQNDAPVGVDFVHRLTDAGGASYMVKFRVYAPHDLQNLVSIFASYGLSGTLDQVCLGLQEEVEIAPKAGSVYMHIKKRRLAPSTNPQPPTSNTTEVSSPSRKPPKRGIRVGNRPASSRPSPQVLLEEDGRDDFDDFLDEEDEEEE